MKILIAIATPSHLAAITFFVSRLLPETEKQVTLLRAVRGEERRAAALALLAQAGADLKQAGIAAEMKVAVGNAGKVVINEAKTGQYDLLIVGHTSAAGQPTRRFTGSVVRRLVAHAPCPVLVVGRETEASVEQILLCDAGTKSPSSSNGWPRSYQGYWMEPKPSPSCTSCPRSAPPPASLANNSEPTPKN